MKQAVPLLAVLAGAIAGVRLGELVAFWGKLPGSETKAACSALGVFVAYCAMQRMKGGFMREGLAMAAMAGSVVYLMAAWVGR